MPLVNGNEYFEREEHFGFDTVDISGVPGYPGSLAYHVTTDPKRDDPKCLIPQEGVWEVDDVIGIAFYLNTHENHNYGVRLAREGSGMTPVAPEIVKKFRNLDLID